LILVAGACLGGCVPGNHPLGAGTAEFVLDDDPLYAADVVDEAGKAVLPRQTPYEKRVQIFMVHSGAPDEGAYVDVQIEPPIALDLVSIDDTCEYLPGTFRCTAAEDGFANFVVRSDSDWSGEAKVVLLGRPAEDEKIDVSPAGLPPDASDFLMVVEGVANDRVHARYNALACTFDPEPDSVFEKWPEGRIRVREAEIHATAPADQPSVVEHAPVIVQTLHPEVFVTRDPECGGERTSLLRLQLDELGRSPKFYFCFSDLGGTQVALSFNSGEKASEPLLLNVAPEPRLLRIVTLQKDLLVTSGLENVVAVTAYDADLHKIPFTVDVRSTQPTVLDVPLPTAQLPDEESDAALVAAAGLSPGTARIAVSPELHDSPRCTSELITVH
jgi:hypothetical protein